MSTQQEERRRRRRARRGGPRRGAGGGGTTTTATVMDSIRKWFYRPKVHSEDQLVYVVVGTLGNSAAERPRGFLFRE